MRKPQAFPAPLTPPLYPPQGAEFRIFSNQNSPNQNPPIP